MTAHIPKFGSPETSFEVNTLKNLVLQAKTPDDLKHAKYYLRSYFVLCSNPHGVIMWRPDINNFEHKFIKEISMLIRPVKRVFYKPTTNSEAQPEKTEFDIAKWFLKENGIVCVAQCDPSRPRMYRIKGQGYVNIFPGFLHVPQELSEFSEEELSKAKLIFTHTRDIWCSGNWELTEYIIKWFAGVCTGKKMYSILYLKSGQGWGKGIITDFIQRYVLGPQLVYKTSDPQTILGSFNGQLLGKLLLLLEEMPTEKSQWNSLYRALKDKVTSDTIEIHEKYKTPAQYKNSMSTIVLTNENALRVENDDRRTVFLDVSSARKGDLAYFKKLGNAMKNLRIGKAFHAYLHAIAKAYPDFDGNPPPMTTSKQEHIISTLPPLFQFMKEEYLVKGTVILPNMPVLGLYNSYLTYCEDRKITPLAKVVVARALSNELDITSTRAYINGNRTRVYNLSKEDLCQKYLAKNWLHEIDEIDGVDIPIAPASDPKALDQFLNQFRPATDISNAEFSSVKQSEKKEVLTEPEVVPEPPKNAPKKIPPPLPPKSERIKEKVKSLKSKSEPIKKAPEQEVNPASIPLPESPKMKPVSVPEPIPEPVLEPYGIPGPSNTSTPEPKPMQPSLFKKNKKGKWEIDDDKLNGMVKKAVDSYYSPEKPDPEPEPEIGVYTDNSLEDFYESAKRLWEENGGDSEDFDSEIFAGEIEDLPNHNTRDPINDPYHYSLRYALQLYRNRTDMRNAHCYNESTYEELAEKFRKYFNQEKGQVVPPPGYKTVTAEELSYHYKVDEREHSLTSGDDGGESDDDNELDEIW